MSLWACEAKALGLQLPLYHSGRMLSFKGKIHANFWQALNVWAKMLQPYPHPFGITTMTPNKWQHSSSRGHVLNISMHLAIWAYLGPFPEVHDSPIWRRDCQNNVFPTKDKPGRVPHFQRPFTLPMDQFLASGLGNIRRKPSEIVKNGKLKIKSMLQCT